MVERRCAIMIIVRPRPAYEIESMAACTSNSLLGSRDDVASSRIKIVGSLISALAIAMHCFCPPVIPAEPTLVLMPSSRPNTKLALAFLNASLH